MNLIMRSINMIQVQPRSIRGGGCQYSHFKTYGDVSHFWVCYLEEIPTWVPFFMKKKSLNMGLVSKNSGVA